VLANPLFLLRTAQTQKRLRSYNLSKSDILSLADVFDQYGAKLTLELKEPVAACEARGDYYFKGLEDRRHAVGVHADAGGVPDADDTWQEMSVFMQNMKTTLEKQGVSVRRVSGYCSPLDWPASQSAVKSPRLAPWSAILPLGNYRSPGVKWPVG
jgi:hypothetical protein